ncbi:tripartite motif-containing protein 12A [Lingula anatina]|uniref:Tripartite motif-containing protein 12A n=1 Tax=Lingula anatina TaxID=7574 RepID=A0A1S3IZK7_LINAN|nr:tripartite motif-containing protein 12A [Lingula anatina]|eukprot:XP_013403632.1 tripartite motif-containing protein 12A [Lingula anatina]
MATNQLLNIKQKFTEEFLKCEVCFDENISTRRLPCKHNFCLSCLGKIADGKDKFSCPKCRATVIVPEGGVDQFPEDVPTRKMLDFAKSLHVAGDKSFFCEHHPNKPLDLYCKRDNTLICGTCVVKQHKGHDAETIEDAALEKRKYFQKMAYLQDEALHDIQNEISGLQKTRKYMETGANRVVTNVIKMAENIKMSVERRCDMLCDKIQKIQSVELYKLEQEQKNLREREDEVKTTKQRYLSLLKKPTAVEMMFSANSVEHLKTSFRDVPTCHEDVRMARIKWSKMDIDSQVKEMFGQLVIEKKDLQFL